RQSPAAFVNSFQPQMTRIKIRISSASSAVAKPARLAPQLAPGHLPAAISDELPTRGVCRPAAPTARATRLLRAAHDSFAGKGFGLYRSCVRVRHCPTDRTQTARSKSERPPASLAKSCPPRRDGLPHTHA